MNDISITRPKMLSEAVTRIETISNILKKGGSIPIGSSGVTLQGVDINFDTEHFLHGGIYSRTIHIPAAFMLCGSLIRVKTILTVSGDMQMYNGESWTRLHGYNVLACNDHRRGMGFAQALTHVTMLYATQAKTVKEAEKEFTHEWEHLMPAKEV